MKNKIIKKWLGIFICAFSFFVFNDVQAQVWQETLENQFDIAESFDELQDWSPPYARGTVIDQNSMPKKMDGSSSIWNAYSYWPTISSPSAWIKNHGSENVWQGTGKSMIFDMDMNDTTANLGPGRLKAYFGGPMPDSISPYTNAGVEESGYRGDVYIFEMIKLPYNLFPKIDGVNKYYSYFKFHVLATGKTNVEDCTEGRDDCEYGASNIHTMFFTGSSYDNKQRFKLEYYSDADWADLNLPIDGFQMWKPTTTIANLDGYIDTEAWFGLEVHVYRGDPGVANGYQEYWLYDADGTSHYVGRVPSDYIMMTADHDWGFNYFFQGGNISFQPDVESQGLDTTYYVDDIILDNNRIGPTYFSLLNNQSISETCSDSIQNQDETGIDCGGVCDACVVPTTYNLTNFISAITNWLGIGNETSDVNSDGIVNTRDLGVMMSRWSQ